MYRKSLIRAWLKLRCLSLIVVLSTALLIQPVPTVHGSAPPRDLYVDTVSGNDDGVSNDCLTPSAPCKTITHAVTPGTAFSGDTIHIAAGLYQEQKTITITPDLTLIGAGAGVTTIDGGGATSTIGTVLQVADDTTATISDITIQNGYDIPGPTGNGEGSGLGISPRGRLTLLNSTISGNHASGNSAGIDNYGTLTVINSTIINNTAGGSAGGIGNGGQLTLSKSTIISNTAQSSEAGISNTGVLTITDSTISNNISSGHGGGIGNTSNLGRITITNSTIISNTAQTNGAGIFNSGGALQLFNTTVSGNMAGGSGGGIFNSTGENSAGGTLQLFNATVSGNTASGPGRGIGSNNTGSVQLANTLLAENSSLPSDDPNGSDCYGPTVSQGYNLIQNVVGCAISGDTNHIVGGDPHFTTSLQDNGGPTQTQALGAGSPAIDAGSPEPPGSSSSACLITDQRGVLRPLDGDGNGMGQCDIGAYEAPTAARQVQLDLATAVSTATVTAGMTLPLTYTLTVTATGGTATAALTATLPLSLTIQPQTLQGPVGTSYDATNHQVLFNGSVPLGSPLVITYAATMNPDVPAGSLLNTTTTVTGAGYTLQRGVAVAIKEPAFTGTLVLIYASGNNNLANSMVTLLNNAEKGAGNSNIVAMMVLDGPGPNDSYLYHLHADTQDNCPNYISPTCDGKYVLGQNMWSWTDDLASAPNLADFISKEELAYPNAGQVVLSLVGHGGGWSPTVLSGQPSGHGTQPSDDPLGGMLWDDSPASSLSTADLGTALSTSKVQSGRGIDLLFLDACEMAMAEVAYQVKDSVHYLLASENWKWAAFPYDAHLKNITADKNGISEDAGDIGQQWLAEEVQAVSQQPYEPYTYSLMDLTKMDELRDRIITLTNALTSTLSLTPTNDDLIMSSLDPSICFDSTADGTINDSDTYCDLAQFAANLNVKFGANSAVGQAATDVQQAVTAMIGSGRERHLSGSPWVYPTQQWNWSITLGGISLFVPLKQDDWRRSYYGHTDFALSTHWDVFLNDWWTRGNKAAVPPPDPTCPPACSLPPGQLTRYFSYLPFTVK